MRKVILILGISAVVILLIIGGILLWQENKSSKIITKVTPTSTSYITISPTHATSSITSQPTPTENIIISSPKSMQKVTLPITITGLARVFENQFNYRVLDVNSKVILLGSAYAKSPDTGQFGDYTIKIPSLPTMRANAITLSVFDYSAKDGSITDEFIVPVVFDPTNSIPVNVFLGSNKTQDGQECTTVYPVEHHVAKTSAIARSALEELLRGPMISEKSQGYYSSINEGVTIQKLVIENGVAKVDFSKKLEEGVGGSCKVTFIRAQITKTLKQFSSVKDVVISIDGRTEDILQP